MERYKTLKVVGDGTFGTVFKATNRATGEICAIKKMKKPFSSWDECLNLREVKSLRKFNSPFIVKLKEVFRVNDELHLVFEFMEENLYELIKDRAQGLPEPQIKSIISQILQGLVYMHKHGFFHRDLKPENLMITGTSVKITDFGLAREIRSKPPFTDYVSTRWYRAPEILLRSTAYNSPVDLFALGCIMAELFTLRPLAPGNNETDQILRFCAILGSPSVNSWPDGFKLASDMGFRFPNHQPIGLANLVPNASPEALEVMSALLQWDPHKRPTAVEALRFSFFEVKEEPKGGEGSLRTSSKWSHGSSRITGNSSKGKWSFKATFSSKDLILPQLRENHEARAGRVKVDVVEKEQKLPSLYRKTPTRKISRERMAYNKAEILSPRGLQPKFFTNHLVSPKNPIKLPPIPSLNHTGNVLRKQGSRGQLLNNY